MSKAFAIEKYNALLSRESYLREISQVPLLTPEEEFKLAARYRKFNDPEAADKLVTSNLRFVVKVAMEYRTYGIKLLELMSIRAEDVVALVEYVQQASSDVMYGLVRILSESPALSTVAGATVLIAVLASRARRHPGGSSDLMR